MRKPFGNAKPRIGTRGTYSPGYERPDIGFDIVRVEDALCWARYDNQSDVVVPFIWRHQEGLNTLHDWPGKRAKPRLIPVREHPFNRDRSAFLVSPARESVSIYRLSGGFLVAAKGLAVEGLFPTEQAAREALARAKEDDPR